MNASFRSAWLLGLFVITFQVQAAALPGAIFTTVADGTVVNANTQYTSKCDVYLNGGPGAHAPAKAAGLPAGEYFFQVTDPSGRTLLSTDVVNNRRFQVSAAGVITAYTGTGGPVHPTGIDQTNPPELAAITIRLANTDCPADYLDSPNAGGVYKVWVTPVASFVGDPYQVDNTCGNGCFHGFAASASKTDNYKVQVTTATFCLSVAKELLEYETSRPGTHWPISLTDPNGGSNNYYTNDTDGTLQICGLVAGNYTAAELPVDGYEVIGLEVNGELMPDAQPTYSFAWTAGQPAPQILFRNRLIAQ